MKNKVLLALLVYTSFLQAQTTSNPEGFYYKTGGNGADQWFQVLATENDDFAITDIYGQGFNTNFNDGLAQINAAGIITVSSTATATSYTLNRTVGTDSTFPLTADNLFTPNPLFAGAWNISELLLDPITGEVLQQFDGSFEFVDVFTLSVRDQGLRFNDSNNIFFQGVMNGSDQIVFRYLRNPYVNRPTTGPYATIPGSTNNFARDNVGTGQFTDINHFEVLLGIQSFTPDSLDQFLLKISGTRAFPLPMGDVNGDRVKNSADLDLITAAIGQVKNQDDGFNIASDLNSDGLIDHRDVKIFNGETTPTMTITTAMTALWYDPTHDGEGWDLQILNEQTAALSWYTYNELGEQMWMTGLGSISGNEINFPVLNNISQGTKFGQDFDPDEVILGDWGSANIHFKSCNEAGFSYSSRAGFGHGGLQPTRLINHSGLDCVNQLITPAAINPFSGLWYDPAHNGEGWMIQVSDTGTAFVSWYTYDENAKPMWIVGTGSIDENVLTFNDLIVTSGATFGPQFDPNDVQRTAWGSFTFTLNGCHQGSLSYNAIRPELGNGTLSPVRLASVAELDCVE